MIQQDRRLFLSGMVAIIAAPAIVRASSLMPIKAMGRYSGGAAMSPWANMTADQIHADLKAFAEDLMRATYPGYSASDGLYSAVARFGDGPFFIDQERP